MSHQQSPFLNTLASRRRFWSDPVQILANQQGIVTQEQRRLLYKGPGCLSTFIFVLFIFSTLTTCITIGVVIQMLSAGKFIILSNFKAVGLVIPLVLTIILGTLVSVLQRAHKARFQHATDALVIEWAQGEIVWQHGKYIACTPSFQLTTTAKSPPLPPPGPYRLYYVAGQKILLSAQPIHTYTSTFAQPGALAATSGDEQARQALQLALCSTLDFSLPDLDTNRRGMLTNTQHYRLSSKVFWNIVGSLIGLLIIGGSILLGIVSILNGWITNTGKTDLPTSLSTMGLTVVVYLVVGAFVLLILTMFWKCLRYLTVGTQKAYAEIRHAPVQKIEGHLKGREESSSESSNYYYDIGQLSFDVSEEACKALISGVRYRVYYLASSKTLLSVEPLTAPVR